MNPHVMNVPSLEIFNNQGKRTGILKVIGMSLHFEGDIDLAAQVFFEQVVKSCIDANIQDVITIKNDDGHTVFSFKLINGYVSMEGAMNDKAFELFEMLKRLTEK